MTALTPRQLAARELLIRRKARENVLAYAKAIDIPGAPVSEDPDEEVFQPIETTMAAHHRLILETMERISKQRYGRCMLLMPPGSAKSSYASVVFPSRYLGENPRARIILASYASDLAVKMGRRVRSIIKQPRYQGIWGAGLSAESKAADQFILTNGSEYMAGGILSGLTGNRASGLIIDDPIKNRQEADSPTIRDRIWEEYTDSAKSRLIPGGWICIIQTRWHEDDLAGRILPEDWMGESGPIKCRDGRVWEVICLQARCEKPNDPLGRKIGEYLWPEWFDQDYWDEHQQNPRTWSSLYQQLPREPEGTLFKQESMLHNGLPVQNPTACDYVYAVIDTAFKAGDKNDGTAVTFWARNKFAGIPLILLDWDVVKIQADLLEGWVPSVIDRLTELSIQCGARFGSAGTYIEDRASGIILLQMAPRKGWDVHAIQSMLTAQGKDTRAVAISTYVYRGDVKISEYAYNKTVQFNGRLQNHFLSQFFGYRTGLSNQVDDIADTAFYAIALALGDESGV